MATFLEMCNKVNTIVGLQGTITSVVSPVGIQRNIVQAVKDSWIDIQTLREDWTFMIGSLTSFSTIQGQSIYTPAEVFGGATEALDLGTYKRKRGIWLDRVQFSYIPFEDLPYVQNENQRRPLWYSVNPGNNSLILELPDGIYNLEINYNRAIQELSVEGDVPDRISANYHNAIVYKAVEKIATYIGNSGIFQNYSREANFRIGELQRNYIRNRRVYNRSFVL